MKMGRGVQEFELLAHQVWIADYKYQILLLQERYLVGCLSIVKGGQERGNIHAIHNVTLEHHMM